MQFKELIRGVFGQGQHLAYLTHQNKMIWQGVVVRMSEIELRRDWVQISAY